MKVYNFEIFGNKTQFFKFPSIKNPKFRVHSAHQKFGVRCLSGKLSTLQGLLVAAPSDSLDHLGQILAPPAWLAYCLPHKAKSAQRLLEDSVTKEYTQQPATKQLSTNLRNHNY